MYIEGHLGRDAYLGNRPTVIDEQPQVISDLSIRRVAHWSPLTLMHLAGAALYAGTAITLFFLGRSTQAVVALICAGGGAAFALARFTRSKAR